MAPHAFVLEPVARKLSARRRLSFDEAKAVKLLPCKEASLDAGSYLVREGEKSHVCCALLSGFTYQHKSTGSGARQILAIQLRGDLIGLPNAMLECADHNVQALSRIKVALIPCQAVADLIVRHPAVGQALWAESLVDASLLREWILNVGQRDAKQRIAHLFCELALRQKAAGICSGSDYAWPMTQEQVADATGMTPVHVNRTLQRLRSDGLITLTASMIRIPDLEALEIAGDFSRGYLHQSSTEPAVEIDDIDRNLYL
jgi:CRP-like cAMP-binding protein